MASDDTINRFVTAADIMHRKRVAEAESRISTDLWASRMSRRARRAVVICAGLAVLGVSGAATAAIVAIHANQIAQQQNSKTDQQTETIMRALAGQNRLSDKETQRLLNAIASKQESNHALMTAVAQVVDPDYIKDMALPVPTVTVTVTVPAAVTKTTSAPAYRW